VRDWEAVPEDMKIEARRRYTYLKRLKERGHYQFRKEETKIAIKEISKEIEDPKPPSYASVQRWKKKAGPKLDIRKLVDRIHLKGNRTDRLDPEVQDRIDEIIDEFYLTENRKSIEETHSNLCDSIREDNKFRDDKTRMKLPSYWSIWSTIQKIDRYELVSRRYGKSAAEAMYSAAGVGPLATRPLELVEIDHTKLDVFVIDEETGLPIGRPWIVVMMDRATRMPIGVHISFDPPSVQTVVQCFYNAVNPKNYLAELYPNIKGDWPAFGLPYELHLDRAMENVGHDLDDICASLGVHVRFSPRKRPWFKGTIERYFRTINEGLLHMLDGTTFSNFLLKGDEYDPEKNALVDIKQLHHLVHKWIVDIYIRRKHRTIKNTPYRAWVDGVNEHEINYLDDIDTLKAHLGCVEHRVLSRKGIELENLVYFSEPIIHWLRDPEFTELSTKTKTGFIVKIKYDPVDISKIRVFDPRNERYFEMLCTDLDYATGVSLHQHKRHCEYIRNELNKTVNKELLDRAKVEIAQMIEDIRQGVKGKGKTKTRQGAARYKGIGREAPSGDSPGAFSPAPAGNKKRSYQEVVKQQTADGKQTETPLLIDSKKTLKDEKGLFAPQPSDNTDYYSRSNVCGE